MKKKIYILFGLFICFFLLSIKRVDAAFITCGDSFANAYEITHGEYLGGSLGEDESCYFSINVGSGYELDIDYEIIGENFFGNVSIYDESESELSGSDEKEGVLKWLGSSNMQSRYYLVIENSYTTDSYNINISLSDRTDAGTGADIGGDFEEAAEIDYGEYDGYLSSFIYGVKGGNDQYDYYKLLVNSGDKVTVRVTPEGDFFAGCAIYDGNRSERFNEEGLDLTGGEIIQESFDVDQDGYVYIVVKWPYFGGLENRIDKYNLLVTNETIDDLGGQISTDDTDSISMNTKNLLILGFSILLIILFLVLIIVVISMMAKKKKAQKKPSSACKTKTKQINENLPITKSPKKVQVTVDEGTEVEVKRVKREKINTKDVENTE